MLMHVANYSLNHVIKTPCRTSALIGHEWIQEIINGHDVHCFQMFRMRKDVFLQLCNVLQCNYGHEKACEFMNKLGLLLYVLGQPGSIRKAEKKFQDSRETISRQFHSVLKEVCGFSRDIIKPIDPTFNDTSYHNRNDERYYPYFKDCVGVIDGTHVKIIVVRPEKFQFLEKGQYHNFGYEIVILPKNLEFILWILDDETDFTVGIVSRNLVST